MDLVRGFQIAMAGLVLACAAGAPLSARAEPDIDAPVITSIGCSPGAVDVSTGPGAVTCTGSFTDTQSGVASFVVQIQSPSRSHAAGSCSSGNLISGTRSEGTLQCNTVIGHYVEPGTWTVTQIDVHDREGNTRSYSGAQLEEMQLATTIEVTD